MKFFKASFSTQARVAMETDKTDNTSNSMGSVSSVSRFGGSTSYKGWSDLEIWRRIQSAEPVKIWSSVLGEWVYWVRDETIRREVESYRADTVVYTLSEIQELIMQCCGNVELRAIHETKKVFLGASVQKAAASIKVVQS